MPVNRIDSVFSCLVDYASAPVDNQRAFPRRRGLNPSFHAGAGWLYALLVTVTLCQSGPLLAGTWIGYKGERVTGGYSFGWPKKASPVVKTYAEALRWTREEARKPGVFWWDPDLIVSDALTLYFSNIVDDREYDYYSHNYLVTDDIFTGGPGNTTGEPRCYQGDWVPYCADHTAVNEKGHYIYANSATAFPAGVVAGSFGYCASSVDPCNSSSYPVSEWRSNASFPVVAVYEVEVDEPDPKNLGACNANNPGPQISNPVNVGIGNKYQQETDVVNANGLKFTRSYNAMLSGPSAIGRNWSHAYGQYIEWRESDPGNARVVRDDGALYAFTWSGQQWVASAEQDELLEQLLDGGANPVGWRYRSSDNTIEGYDHSGRLISITDVRGNISTLSYDAGKRLERVDTNTGEYLQVSHNGTDHIETITDQAGRTWTYRYDADNNLEFVDNPDGTTKQYHYENTNYPHALTGITDERGIRFSTYEYQADGRARASYHAGNVERVDIAYTNDATGVRTVTNSLGLASTYSTTEQLGVVLVTDVSGPGCSTCGSGNTSYRYDQANNNLLSRTENSVTTRFGNYDARGQFGCKVTGVTDADAGAGICTFDPVTSPEARRKDYTYDFRFHGKVATLTESSVFGGSP